MKILEVGRGVPSEKAPLNGIFEFDQAKALAAFGHEIIYATVDLRSIRRKRKLGLQCYQKDGISIVSISIPVGAVPPTILDFVGKCALKLLYKRIEKTFNRPDIVHAHFLGMGVLAADLCSRENIPLVITEHSSIINTEKIAAVTAKRAKYAYARANRVIAVSTALSKNIKKHTNVDAIVVPNIVNLPQVDVLPSVKNNEFRFISAGNLKSSKGFDVLIRAFAEVEKVNPDIKLMIMGAGSEGQRLKKQVRDMGLENKISFFGIYARSQFVQELLQSDAFVLATKSETFGVVFVEAMSCGLPVIATRSGGPEDIVDESNGLLVDVDDEKGLAEAMLNIINNIGRYNKEDISNNTKLRFSSKEIAKQLTCIFEKICRGEA